MKILMALMGLEIGGAETHVVELSKALKRKGYDIVVASNGGVYQKELEDFGIRHIKVPLHSKKPWLFLESYTKLKRLFKEEKFDIVHAHARIPAYICGLLAKKHSFRFVTTAHWVFKITPLWKRLANWGEKTIAVSDDIKDYLIENYGTWSDNISTTINGIDTVKFSKNVDWSDIKEEFNLGESNCKILYVSRMDEDRSAVAYMVAEAMPEILKHRPDAELIIVGDGNDFSRLKSLTDRINNQIGRRAIILTGGRVDINKFVAAADVFVGVSRSALEAMAAGIPVVIAGNEGYIGIFDESKFKISYDTNYCCRGCIQSSTELVQKDLVSLVTMSDEELEKIKSYNKGVIEKFYSADKMAQDYADMYESLTPLEHYKHGDIIINGYYGYKNTGDEALLQGMIENIRSVNKNAKITVLSASPKETANRYSVNSIYRYNLCKVAKEMKHASLFISGGGSLLQDVTSTKSLVFYTEMIKLAKKMKLKVMVYANGFGPITKPRNIKRVKEALDSVSYISMRDPASTEALSELMPNLTVHTTADPAFSLGRIDEKWERKLCSKFGLKDNEEYFAISLRDWQYSDSKTVEKISEYCSEINKRYSLTPVFVTMQNSKDLSIIQRVIDRLEVSAITIKNTSAKELLTLMQKMKFSIGMRLHFLVFSAIASVPTIGLSYDPKINSLVQHVGLDVPFNSREIDVAALLSKTDEILKNADSISQNLKNKKEEMRLKNADDAKALLDLTK